MTVVKMLNSNANTITIYNLGYSQKCQVTSIRLASIESASNIIRLNRQ
jgi:hypothetical protein